MPLTHAEPRTEIHTRNLDLHVYRREDGLFDVEGHLIDVKPITIEFHHAKRSAGEPVHDLRLRLTIDQHLEVRSAEAKMDVGAYPFCTGAEPNFAALVGLRIGSGWNRRARERVGGGKGCTHLVEMLSQMATAALQAIWSDEDKDSAATPPQERQLAPSMLDSCYTYRSDSQFVKFHYPRYFRDAADGG